MSIFRVDQMKCEKCGICIEICPTRILEMGENGPEATCEERCIACGQCVAVCPYDALDNENNLLAKQVPIRKFPVLDAPTAENFLRSRRSVRCYKKEKVNHETLLKLLDIARFAPTPSNSQGLSYIIIESPEVLQGVIAATADWMEEQNKAGLAWAQRYERYVRIYKETGKDVITRGAPNLIVATAPEDFRFGRDNTCFSLAYVELYATALGLGSCWMGFIEWCAMSKYPPLIKLLDVPPGMKVTGMVAVGYPKYTLMRFVDRNALNVTWGQG